MSLGRTLIGWREPCLHCAGESVCTHFKSKQRPLSSTPSLQPAFEATLVKALSWLPPHLLLQGPTSPESHRPDSPRTRCPHGPYSTCYLFSSKWPLQPPFLYFFHRGLPDLFCDVHLLTGFGFMCVGILLTTSA